MKKKELWISFFALVLVGLVVWLVWFFPHKSAPAPFGEKFVYETEDGRSLLGTPRGMAFAEDGTCYVADSALNVIWKVTEQESVIVAGQVQMPDAAGVVPGGYRDAEAAEALFNGPTDLIVYKDGLVISDTQNHVLRYYHFEEETVSTFAGTHEIGLKNGRIEHSAFSSPAGLCLDENGNLYVADSGNHAIRKIDPMGNVTTFLGGEAGMADGSFDVARLCRPTDIACENGRFYIADNGNSAVRAVENGKLETICRAGTALQTGKGEQATLISPTSLWVEGETLWICDLGAGAVCILRDDVLSVVLRSDEADGVTLCPYDLVVQEKQVFYTDTAASCVSEMTR